MKSFTKEDIVAIAQSISSSSDVDQLLEKLENYRRVDKPKAVIHNFYYLDKQVFDYSDFNTFSCYAVLFLDSYTKGDKDNVRKYGDALKKIFLKFDEINFLIDYTYCDNAFDGFLMANIAHLWLCLREVPVFKDSISGKEKERIMSWFHKRARLMAEDKDKPTYISFRPYDNQCIGVGCLVLLARVIEDFDSILSKQLLSLADERIIGWEERIGNPDDTPFYDPIFCKNLFFYAWFRPKKELIYHPHCLETFESILHKTYSDGTLYPYNWPFSISCPDLMALGGYLFRDGRFMWLASKMLEEKFSKRLRRREYALSHVPSNKTTGKFVEMFRENISSFTDFYEGVISNVFHLWLFWDDSIPPVPPHFKSTVIRKSSGSNAWPFSTGTILSEKVIFRSDWGGKEFMAILNLWGQKNSPVSGFNYHRYPGSNELITLFYEEPFLVQNTKFLIRDIGVEREELNAFDLLGEEQKSRKKETYNSHLSFFREDKLGSFSKSILENYSGWTNERVCVLIPQRFFTIIDHCTGFPESHVGIRWHLKGNVEVLGKEEIVVELFGNKLKIMFPLGEDHDALLQKVSNENPVYEHQADFLLTLRTKESTHIATFITIFIPIKDPSDIRTNSILVKPINPLDARRAERGGYPWAVGISIDIDEERWRVISRVSSCNVAFDFGNIVTDAELMIVHFPQNETEMIVSFTKVTHISFKYLDPGKVNVIDFQGDKPDYWASTKDSIIMLWREPGSGLLVLPR